TGPGRFAGVLDEFGVAYELVRTTRGPLPDPLAFDGALVLGGSLSADDATLVPVRNWIREAVLAEQPYLGVGLGGQLLARELGAKVRRDRAETGIHEVFLTDAAARDPLFGSVPRRFEVFGWHGESFDLPHAAVPLAGSVDCTYEAFRYGAAAYGLQFHPEVRPRDLANWHAVPGYRQLSESSGREWDVVVAELARASAALDQLASELLERWLYVVAGASTLAARLPAPA